MNTDNLLFVQLNEETYVTPQQYADIAELIYHTDPYIYPAIFGDGNSGIEKAKIILPTVIESKKDTMFQKKNLFVAIFSGEIVGLILWHSGNLYWDCSELINVAKMNNIHLNKYRIKQVEKEYVSERYTGNDTNELPINIINVCVKTKCRHKGIASRLLESFIDEHLEDNMELTVLSENKNAISLYEKQGFSADQETKGFALSKQKPLCLIMKRSSKNKY